MAEIDNGVIYKTKLINFFSRSILIVLENGTSTSLLVSICNVLLLRGDARLDLNWTQVSQQDLMSLVVDSLLNSEQQEKIAEAISLLPNLLSDVHVDVCFGRIDDYEFIPEQSIFKLLGISLFHGWIVDPQDIHAAAVIGSKSYSAMRRVIASIKSRKAKREGTPVEDSQVFPVTNETTASSNLTVGQRRGDIEEAEALARTLLLSEKEKHTLAGGNSDKITCSRSSSTGDESEKLQQPMAIGTLKCNASISSRNDSDPSDHKELKPKDRSSISPGEGCKIYPGDQTCEDQESDYEEEDFLPELGEEQEYHLMQNFLDSFPSQLTDYGLFHLIEGLKEQELCIFFRNDHFNTLFKYNGKLYLLEASESHINHENLVWTELTLCTGDLVFVNGSFEEFKAEKQDNWWNKEQVFGQITQKDSKSADSTLDYIDLCALSGQLDEIDSVDQLPNSSSIKCQYQSGTIEQ